MDGIKRTAARTAIFMAFLTLISKLTGFLREMVIANFFGTSYITDAYVMAAAIPGIIFAGVWDSVVTSYTPLYSKIKEQEGEAEGNRFTSEVLNILIFVSLISSIIGLLFSDQLIAFFASGFVAKTAELASFYLKITFSYMIFQSVAGILNSYLQYKGVYLAQIIIGYFQNFFIILIVIVSAITSEYFLAFGGLLAWAARCISLAIISKKNNYRYSFGIQIGPAVKRIIALAIPVFIGSNVNQIGVFVDKTLASRLPEGSVSALNYAMTIMGLITGLTIAIFNVIIYPKLTQAVSLDDMNRFGQMMRTSVILILLITVPFTLGSMLYSHQVVQIIYERGAFNEAATALTQTAFFYYTLSMIFTSLSGLFVFGYYAMHDMKTPVIFAIICVIMNIILNLLLVGPMRHNGLALATSIAAICNTFLLYAGFKTKYKSIPIVQSRTAIFKIVLASVIAVGCSYGMYSVIITYYADVIYARMVQLFLAVLVAAAVYVPLLLLFKVDEIKMVRQIIKQ